MKLSYALVVVFAAFGVLGLAHAQTATEEVETNPAVIEAAKEAAFQEADNFAIGAPVEANAALVELGVVTEDSVDPELKEIAEDADFILEEETTCCDEGSFCCGFELGCLPDALAPNVTCPPERADGMQPCCMK